MHTRRGNGFRSNVTDRRATPERNAWSLRIDMCSWLSCLLEDFVFLCAGLPVSLLK